MATLIQPQRDALGLVQAALTGLEAPSLKVKRPRKKLVGYLAHAHYMRTPPHPKWVFLGNFFAIGTINEDNMRGRTHNHIVEKCVKIGFHGLGDIIVLVVVRKIVEKRLVKNKASITIEHGKCCDIISIFRNKAQPIY